VRLLFSVIFLLLILALAICAGLARRSRKSDGTSVELLLLSLIVPVTGNLILVLIGERTLALLGYYIYFLGMDLTVFALLRFSVAYCRFRQPGKGVMYAVRTLLGADVLQLLLNLRTGHAFAIEEIQEYGYAYYRLIAHLGQTFHRVVCYGIIAAVLVLFLVKMRKVSRVNRERYAVIFFAIILVGIWESYYIFSRTPMDRSMIGFGVFGLMVFYLTLYYRPMRLLDRMLAAIASELPDALFFFDTENRCIWVNPAGIALAGVQEGRFEEATDWLTATYGPPEKKGEGWSAQRILGSGEETKCYVLEKRVLSDDRGKPAGSFLRIRDNTAEQRTLQKEIYNATHDSLTGVYNRAGYNLLFTDLELSTTFLLLVDGDNFKSVNDTYGHEIGDRILRKIAERVQANFRPGDHVCRVGGDEFVVLLAHTKPEQGFLLGPRIDRINQELSAPEDGLPPITVSVGIAHGADVRSAAGLFDHADKALYAVKGRGKSGYAFYSE
jgi:diguanylate cyclase (GGDEF)-like protein